MEEETQKAQEDPVLFRSFELLFKSQTQPEITVRDDQYDYPWLLDAAKACRGRSRRFRLVDSGFLNRDQLEWLAQAGADIYTDDKVSRSEHDLDVINSACRQGHSILALFFNGPLEKDIEADDSPYSSLLRLAGAGVYIHVTNREHVRDLAALNDIAHACLKAGSWLVYYHHGVLSDDIINLAESGSWIHLAETSLTEKNSIQVLRDVLKSAKTAGTGVVLYIEKKIDISWLWDILKSGGFLLFKNEHFDYRSPYRAVEEEAVQNKLDHRAYFLHTTHLP